VRRWVPRAHAAHPPTGKGHKTRQSMLRTRGNLSSPRPGPLRATASAPRPPLFHWPKHEKGPKTAVLEGCSDGTSRHRARPPVFTRPQPRPTVPERGVGSRGAQGTKPGGAHEKDHEKNGLFWDTAFQCEFVFRRKNAFSPKRVHRCGSKLVRCSRQAREPSAALPAAPTRTLRFGRVGVYEARTNRKQTKIRNGQNITVMQLNPGRASKPVKLESKQPRNSTVLKVKPYIDLQKERRSILAGG
jgi:hypothetical protein